MKATASDGVLFRSRRGAAVVSGACALLVAVVAIVVVPVWLSIGRGDPAVRTANALLRNGDVREEGTRFLVDKLEEETPEGYGLYLDLAMPLLGGRLDSLAANERFIGDVDVVVGNVYDFLVENSAQSTTLDVDPVLIQLIDTLAGVDPRFVGLADKIEDFDGVTLERPEGFPDLARIDTIFDVGVALLLALGLVALLAYLRWARSSTRALGSIGAVAIVLGTVSIVADRAARSFVASSVEGASALTSTAVPVVAESLLSPFVTVGGTLLVLGLGSAVAAIVLGRRR